MERNTQEIADVLLRLEEPFDKDEVRWLVAATSRDGRKGRVTPYANPRAYTDRLNEVLTASGWTRQYAVHTISPVTRIKKDKMIQTGKVLVTCTVSIAGIGSHSGSGEEWADDENAMTSAEAQAFSRMQPGSRTSSQDPPRLLQRVLLMPASPRKSRGIDRNLARLCIRAF